MRRALPLLALALLAPVASAQQTTAPEPIVTVTVNPPRVVVGQQVTVKMMVLAPNYMPSPPVLPDFQIRNAVTRGLGNVNQSETRDGVSYAGILYEAAVFPQEVGSYAFAGGKVTVTYAADPPQTRTVAIEMPRVAFEAFIPEAARDLDPFVSASSLALEQKVERSSQDLKVGDSIKRTITVKVAGTPAMLVPPPAFGKIDGLALYPDEPVLQDNLDRRSSVLSGTRTDAATYMLQRAGDYTLPAIDFAWWNARDSKIERARGDAVMVHVADNPALQASAPGEPSGASWDWHAPVFWLLDHWLLTVIALLLAGAVTWFVPAAVREIRERMAARRSAYLASEAWSFAQLRSAIHGHDPQKAYFALLGWLDRLTPAQRQSARDPLLDREIDSIESNLFGPQNAGIAAWSPRRLLKRVTAARRRLRRSGAAVSAPVLPAGLNPSVPQRQAGFARRPVAR